MKKRKYLQIFKYLLEFSKLRSKPVRDIEGSETQYPEKVWFADIPQYEIFDCITFPNYNLDADYWLKIGKPREPEQPTFPKINKILSKWIILDSLKDENGIPTLKDSILEGDTTIFLSDKPEIDVALQSYLDNNWIDDLELYKEEYENYEIKLADYEKQSKTYKQLFSIYNKAQQFGEEYELVVGVGLLYFKENHDTPLIRRHVLTSKAEIAFEFSAMEACVKVFPSIENEIQIENDAIIDLFDQFESTNIIEATKNVAEFLKEKNISDSPFDSKIKEAIQIFADRLRADGKFKDDLAKPQSVPQIPTVYFSPALLLRKRNTKSFTALYEKIVEDINLADDSINISTINNIIDDSYDIDDSLSNTGTESSFFPGDDTIYFPKKYNDEQIEIIERSRRNNKVLVQGPPGTGKSHTIANLICHLLANGKKILVTAYTKRALEVLKKQLPKDFQNLTVNLLSGDSESLHDLDASVNAINDELSRNTNLDKSKKEIEKNIKKLSLTKEQKANTKNEWLKVKEKSTRSQNINRYYQGTLAESAEKIEKERFDFAWFKDDFTNISETGLTVEIENFYSLTKYYQGIDCSFFNFVIPEKEKLLTAFELDEYKKISHELSRKYAIKTEYIPIQCQDYTELIELLHLLHDLFLQIENNTSVLKTKLVNNYQNDSSLWKEKLDRTNKLLDELPEEELKQFDRSVEIKYPNDMSLIQIKNDAEALLVFLSEGNALYGILFILKKAFLPKNIKEKLYFIDVVKVNGSPCDTMAEFQTVLNDIKIKQDFEELESIWNTKPTGNSKAYFDKVKFFEQLKKDIEILIKLLEDINEVRALIEEKSSVRIKDYESATTSDWLSEAEYNFLLTQVESYKVKISETNKYLSMPRHHPIASEIIESIANIDTYTYEEQLSRITTLNSDREKYHNYKNLQENLQIYLPILVNEILESSIDDSNFGQIEDAIHFKHAEAEIKKLLSEDYETKLIYKLADLELQEEKLISTIASKKAWLYVLEALSKNSSLCQHLQAWVLAIKRIGKTGTGKRALKFRKEAQRQMEECKDSIPCWIMPLYKVSETINPEQGMYDYVIIDEASQLGADAIFLLYIAKKIIIVGDDKQTSPQYVGVDANTMTPHIASYLQDIPFANYYGTDFSFFDHAQRFCKGKTVLREHFRCMPEIIEFCNKHFYAPDGKGLYPLKQYSENRLEPLKTIFCQSGYIDGTYQNITNKVEAEAVANQIAELVEDERYKLKSFGVIALQGNKQASLIENLILKRIGEVEFKKRNIICGNSASFQGDERDIMFLSLITAHNHNRSALTKPEDERRFNVAVSRAKEQVWLFHSVQLDDFSNTNDLRYKLLDHFINYKPQTIPPQGVFKRTMGTQPTPFESWFEVDVYNDIVSNKYRVIPQYEVAKGRYRIDLVVLLSNGINIAVECDGDKNHGPEQFENDLMRQKVLERCGWQFFRVRGAEYYTNRVKALEPLWALLDSNNVPIEQPATTIAHSQNNTKTANVSLPSFQYNPAKIDEPVLHVKLVKKESQINKQPELFADCLDEDIFPMVEKINSIPTEIASDSDEILVFTSLSNVYKIQKRKYSDRLDTQETIDLEPGEKVIYKTNANCFSGFLIVAFKNGKVGKIEMSSYKTEYHRKKLKNAFNNESDLVYIKRIEHDIDLIALSSIDKIVLFNTSQINSVGSRNTKGVQVMKPKDNSIVIKVKSPSEAKLSNPEYYRKNILNAVGYYLLKEDEI